MKAVCVFCASSTGRRPAYARAAGALASAAVARDLTVVYGGASVGLMGAVADEALAAGGRVVGVIPQALVDREIAHPGLTEQHVVGTMHERKARMYDLSDGVVALPGGFGTLDELFEALTWTQLGLHAKPVGLLDVEGWWQPLLAYLDRAVDDGLLHPRNRELVLVDDDPGALLDRMAAWRPVAVEKWVDRGDR